MAYWRLNIGIVSLLCIGVTADAKEPEPIVKVFAKFSGTVKAGETFRRAIGNNLYFVLQPLVDHGYNVGWEIYVKDNAQDLSWVVNPPYHAHRDTEIFGAFCWELKPDCGVNANTDRIRYFSFLTSKDDYDGAYAGYEQSFMNSSNKFPEPGCGRLRIRAMKLGVRENETEPTIESMDFTVEMSNPPSKRICPSHFQHQIAGRKKTRPKDD